MSTYGIDDDVYILADSASRNGKYVPRPAIVALAASLCREVMHEDIPAPPKSLADAEKMAIECHGDSSRAVVRNALSAWVASKRSTSDALSEVAAWDNKLAVWCGCAIAEAAMNLSATLDPSYRGMISLARNWVVGLATSERIMFAALDAADQVAILLEGTIADVGRNQTVSDLVTANYAASFAAATAVSSLRLARAASDFRAAPSKRTKEQLLAEAGLLMRNAKKSVTEKPANKKADSDEMRAAIRLDDLAMDEYWDKRTRREELLFRDVVEQAIFTFPTSRPIAPSRGLVNGRSLAAGMAGVLIGAGAMYARRRS